MFIFPSKGFLCIIDIVPRTNKEGRFHKEQSQYFLVSNSDCKPLALVNIVPSRFEVLGFDSFKE